MRSNAHVGIHSFTHEVVLAVRSNAAGEWEVICDRGSGALAQFKYRDDAFLYALQLAQREQQARVDLYRGDGRLVSSDHYRRHRH
jgi:hypothetical protein